ncbi:SH2B adapter protein 2 [Trichinella nelsoni]|uniref:SH2B adapter protein 2 n=1 Tax=Trichinella nelsoni TaxID=6336 RepID=A0A0V0SL73_9BILA|nr:SH2B adapter protein 2 [Trichinella nelsoni]
MLRLRYYSTNLPIIIEIFFSFGSSKSKTWRTIMSLPVLYRFKRRADEKPFALTEICSKKHRLDEISPPLSGGEPVTLDSQLLNDLRSSVPSTCLQKWKKLKLVDLKRSTTGSDDGEGAETSWMVDTVSLLDLTEPRRKSCKRFTIDEDENEDSLDDYIKQLSLSVDKRNNFEREITCNDVIMKRTTLDHKFMWSRVYDNEDVVYDYLFSVRNEESPVQAEEENLCYWEDETDNNKDDEDSEDSNAENYYTNDYPEEEVEDELDEYYEREDVNRYSSKRERKRDSVNILCDKGKNIQSRSSSSNQARKLFFGARHFVFFWTSIHTMISNQQKNVELLQNGGAVLQANVAEPRASLVWTEFCESCAKFAAYDFAQSWRNYLTLNPQMIDRVSEQEAAAKFVQAFGSYFENEARRICRSSRLLNESIISCGSHILPPEPGTSRNGAPAQYVNSLCSSETDSDSSLNDALSTDYDIKKKKNFFTRFSYKSMKRSFFKKQSSDETVFAPGSSDCDPARNSLLLMKHRKKSKAGAGTTLLTTTKTVVEVVREGSVNFICGKELDGENWEKGRMVLVKTAGGYLLEFYSPPKASKPKNGIFCFLITEVRETTVLETPDCEHTFVLKAENLKEYIVQAKSHKDMRSWLSVLRSCMDNSLCTENATTSSERLSIIASACTKTDSGYRSGDFHSLPLRGSSGTRKTPHIRLSSLFTGRDLTGSSANHSHLASQLRRSYSSSQASHVNTAVRHLHSSGSALLNSLRGLQMSTGAIHDNSCPFGILRMLENYPWFHGSLSRRDATNLVVQCGVDGHGLFLVRQSETRTGEYVLTFNCYGRAKHLRITVLARGHCRVQHLWFESIFDMLDHFRSHHIPLQTSARDNHSTNVGVMLLDYVIVWPPQQGRQITTGPVDPRNYMTHGGSIPRDHCHGRAAMLTQYLFMSTTVFTE